MSRVELSAFVLARCDDAEEEARERIGMEYEDGGWSADHTDRVLDACSAHRTIVEVHDETAKTRAVLDDMYGDADLDAVMGPLRDTLRALASIWSDHEDYRAEWAS